MEGLRHDDNLKETTNGFENIRNIAGSDRTYSFAYKLKKNAGNTLFIGKTTLTTTVTASFVISFKEV